MAYVYILRSRNNNHLYVGSTNDLGRRLAEHERGHSRATRALIPFECVFYEKFQTLLEARRVEAHLKRLKSRAVLERIIKDGIIKFMRE
ncbi:MAG: GIY-YIG nuclease family protein [Candidatus Kerfeldbacteria bacterium]|nr:GIY-YIG nuclease family protein [Candidatus Kerfeldbacteria bacterium]